MLSVTYAERHLCCVSFTLSLTCKSHLLSGSMLNVIMLNVVMLSVAMRNVIILSVIMLTVIRCRLMFW